MSKKEKKEDGKLAVLKRQAKKLRQDFMCLFGVLYRRTEWGGWARMPPLRLAPLHIPAIRMDSPLPEVADWGRL